MLRRLLLAAAVTVVVPLATMLAPSASNVATAATCTGGVAVTSFAFNPASVPPGTDSPLTLVLQNCTSATIQGSTVWYGQYVGQGCPVIDPLPGFPYTIAPGGTYTLTDSYGDPGLACKPTALNVTANVNVNGVVGTVTSVTATLQFIQSTTPVCQVTYVPNNWQGGFTANVTITNTSSSMITGWTLTFTFPGDQVITSAWNAAVTQTGTGVTASNLGYNLTISPGGSQSFGFQGTWTKNDASPTSFNLNGVACT